jgi:hypothetical protein
MMAFGEGGGGNFAGTGGYGGNFGGYGGAGAGYGGGYGGSAGYGVGSANRVVNNPGGGFSPSNVGAGGWGIMGSDSASGGGINTGNPTNNALTPAQRARRAAAIAAGQAAAAEPGIPNFYEGYDPLGSINMPGTHGWPSAWGGYGQMPADQWGANGNFPSGPMHGGAWQGLNSGYGNQTPNTPDYQSPSGLGGGTSAAMSSLAADSNASPEMRTMQGQPSGGSQQISPQMQQFRDAMLAWRGQRPNRPEDMQAPGAKDQWSSLMDAWRQGRPDMMKPPMQPGGGNIRPSRPPGPMISPGPAPGSMQPRPRPRPMPFRVGSDRMGLRHFKGAAA